jgi:hypothetical protein
MTGFEDGISLATSSSSISTSEILHLFSLSISESLTVVKAGITTFVLSKYTGLENCIPILISSTLIFFLI